MSVPPAFGFAQLVNELLRGIADVVADRPGQTREEWFVSHRTAIFSVMAFIPRDVTETMLAGHCVMYDHVMRDAMRDLLHDETASGRRRIRAQFTVLGRIFLTSLAQLGQLQARPDRQAAAPPAAEAEASPAAVPQSDDGAAAQPSSDGAETTAGCVETDLSQLSSTESQQAAAEATSGGKMAPLPSPGFQNRRMRRALQFTKPVSKAAQRQQARAAMAA